MSLAIGGSRGKTTYIYAGVNSSPDSIAKGKNEHLRTLGLEQSKSRASTGAKATEAKIVELARAALFENPDPDAYQRLLRIAGSMGVCATAMGKDSQLAVFDTSLGKLRGVLELPREAEDVDIVQKGENEYQIAFCYKYQLHVVNIGKEDGDPTPVFTIPDDEPQRPVFRSIRYLTPNFLVAVSNLPKRSGVLIQGFRLPKNGEDKARVAVNAVIPRKISATALAVANLSPPASATTPVGDAQFVVAVAGHDSSISLYTLDHSVGTTINLIANLWPLSTLKGVHGTDNITGVAFSTFVTPKTHLRQQFIKLASISLQKTVSVHSIPLKKHIEKAPRNKKAPPRPVRYVTALKAKSPAGRRAATLFTVLFLVLAIIAQGILELYGSSPPILQVHRFVPSWHGSLRDPAHPPAQFLADEFLSKLSAERVPRGETLVLWEDEAVATAADGEAAAAEGDLKVNVHDPAVHGPGVTWEKLSGEQKLAWKKKLKDAGAWTQHMGESVFQGILFGEIAGAVGRAVAG